MKNLLTIVFLVISVSLMGQIDSPFGNLRHSSVDPDGNLHLRFDALPNYEDYSLSYKYDEDWISADLNHIGSDVLETVVPYDFGQRLSYSPHYKMEVSDYAMSYLYAAHLNSNAFPPPLSQMIKIDDDPAEDLIGATNPDLDIAANYMAIYDNHLYRAIQNYSGTYSLAQGFTQYNVYLSLIVNPYAATTYYAYAMIYTFNIPGLISPGLYKVTIDLQNPTIQRLGDIQSTIADGVLHMSCDMDLLFSDPDFGVWPNDINTLSMEDLTLSLMVDFSTMQPQLTEGDLSSLGMVDFTELIYEVAENTLPSLKIVDYDSESGAIELLYIDSEGDFPLQATHIVSTSEGSTNQDMNPVYNVDGSISFFEIASEGSSFSVSDNMIDYVFAYPPVSNADDSSPALPTLDILFTNPLHANSSFCQLDLKGLEAGNATLSLYNLRGQKLLNIAQLSATKSGETITWSGSEYKSLPQGIYFIRLQQAGRSITRKITIIR